jgi:hypothetical protein
MKSLLLALSLAGTAAPAPATAESREVARVCGPSYTRSGATTCCAIIIERGVVLERWIHGSSMTSEEVLGPYLKEYQELVGPKEAPVRLLATSAGWRVVVSWGFQSEHWRWPRFVLYFVSPDGKLRLREEGEGILWQIEAGRFFKTLTDLVLVAQQGSHSHSARVLVWVLPLDGSPRSVLNETALGARIETGTEGKPAGLVISEGRGTGSPHSDWKWEPTFWAWDETTKSFRK